MDIFGCGSPYQARTKVRQVTILKDEVYRDIDTLTYKYAQVSNAPSPKILNEYASDSSEALDGRILSANVAVRDAILRNCLAFALDDSVPVYAVDDRVPVDGKLVYMLKVDEEMKDATLKAAAMLMHRYIVWGALYDWYGSGMGSNHKSNYERDLIDLENEIAGMFRGGSVAKRPAQPFGPAQRLG